MFKNLSQVMPLLCTEAEVYINSALKIQPLSRFHSFSKISKGKNDRENRSLLCYFVIDCQHLC